MRIDFQTHYYPKEYVKLLEKRQLTPKFTRNEQGKIYLAYSEQIVIPRSSNLEKFTEPKKRISEMDANEIDVQVLTIPLPGCDRLGAEEAVEVCRVANDSLAQVCNEFPDRFSGLALLPVQSEEATDEFKRAVKDLGLTGGHVHSNTNGKMLDSQEYNAIFKVANSLNVPVFVHPTIPFHLSNMDNYRLANTFGLQVDLSLSLLKMIFGGILERMPRLKIIAAHLGSTLPFIMNRIDDEFQFIKPSDAKISELPSHHLKRLFVDTVTRDAIPLKYALNYFGADHVLFGSDYPFWNTKEHVETLDSLDIRAEEKEKIFWMNAARLLGID